MIERWTAGSVIVYREVWGEALLAARPVTVVADRADYLVLYSHPATRYRSAALGSARHDQPLEQRIAAMTSRATRTYNERTASHAHVLTLLPPAAWHAVWLFWDADFRHQSWYVNLQEPVCRTARGVEIRDCALDLVVSADRSWRTKDHDEFSALCKCGFFSRELAAAVEGEARRMVEVVERWGPPFCDGWERFRPDPGWRPAELPPDWAEPR